MFVRLFVAAALLLSLPVLVVAAEKEVTLSHVTGEVLLKYEDVEEWVAAEAGMPLTEGDQIWVGEDGRAEMQFKSGTRLALDETSLFDLLVLEPSLTACYLSAGDLQASFPGGKRVALEVETPLASIRVTTRASFRISLGEEGDALEVAVRTGTVSVETVRGSRKVEAGTAFYFEEGFDEFSPLDPPDEWDQWHLDRERPGGKRYGEGS
jgi:hypothetical protein